VHEYRFQATPETVDALRRLRRAWAALFISERAIDIRLVDGTAVRIEVEAADIEDKFEAFRINACVQAGADVGMEDVVAFAKGGNDIVLFSGVTWSEPGAEVVGIELQPGAVMHFSGHPGQLSETAEVVCITTDAFVVASSIGAGLLVRTGLKPNTLQVVRDRETITAFLFERGYQSDA